ncbi:E3 ubiquitin-protein ligase PPP1R11 isoform X1 [Python bivittatus]|uniref:E3 ubiquitin-protein ligase PPP1R11 n=1 Tax=Python bivittatus TaxID=176946 RepID=A0A9F3QUY9_PYTBI|nr:E3 ubiquitin-protein ligase PPP1R11 isoform X1 [Python bivittatus]
MAESTSGVGATTTVTETEVTEPENRSLTIKLRKRKPSKKVEWSSDTVDNEHLGRRSSKCCCIYEKPRAFGESSTESEDEDDEGCGNAHCIRGHKKGLQGKAQSKAGDAGPKENSSQKLEPPDQNHAGAMQH